MPSENPAPRTPPPSPIDRAFLTSDPDAGELILVRHGQQQWPDAEHAKTSEWVDPPLSELGREQAEAVGKYLAGETISAVYSSTLQRAADTGRAIAGHHGLEVTEIEDLAEMRLFDRMPGDQRAIDVIGEHAMDGVRERVVQTRRWDAYPYSESSLDFRRRIGYSIEGILAGHPGETVAVACHGGVINVVAAHIFDIDVDFLFRPSHASVHRVRFGSGRRVLETLNEHAFLRVAELLTY
jgi:broad specificity phosphatase PhoE